MSIKNICIKFARQPGSCSREQRQQQTEARVKKPLKSMAGLVFRVDRLISCQAFRCSRRCQDLLGPHHHFTPSRAKSTQQNRHLVGMSPEETNAREFVLGKCTNSFGMN